MLLHALFSRSKLKRQEMDRPFCKQTQSVCCTNAHRFNNEGTVDKSNTHKLWRLVGGCWLAD
jgi:hypothetical protein